MKPSANTSFDTIIVGGGVVGAALACGLAVHLPQVLVLDGGDRDFRAARGNFGLVWVQGKGADYPPYARLTRRATECWPEFARQLQAATGIDVGLEQRGGYDFCLSQAEWEAREREMRKLAADAAFEYQMLERDELRRRIAQLGPQVVGASFSPLDGHLDPLALLHALHRQMAGLGAHYRANARVDRIEPGNGHFEVVTAGERFSCRQVVCCAGLDNQRLGRMLGLEISLRPQRGQLLITQRLPPLLSAPSPQLRQTREGTLLLGDSHEAVGYDDSVTLEVISRIATRALRIFPQLRDVQIQRAWAALRVLTPDGVPIYQRSTTYPGAFAVACHSGVTLAALHATEIAAWIGTGIEPAYLGAFSLDRFDVSPTRQQNA